MPVPDLSLKSCVDTLKTGDRFMKLILVDDNRKRREQIKTAASKRQFRVIDCPTTNDFLTSIENEKVDLLVIETGAWKKNKSIFNYFKIGKELENLPVILYNAEEDSYIIQDRNRSDRDRILPKPTDVETLIEAIGQNV
jgi:DNA-binding response OmpR family regulator